MICNIFLLESIISCNGEKRPTATAGIKATKIILDVPAKVSLLENILRILLGIPTIFGAWLLTFVESSFTINSSMLAPSAVAFISGLLAIKILVGITVNSKIQYFGIYCLLLSVICFFN